MYDFAAMKTDGSVVVWGNRFQCNPRDGVGNGRNCIDLKMYLDSDDRIFSTGYAFAALRKDRVAGEVYH